VAQRPVVRIEVSTPTDGGSVGIRWVDSDLDPAVDDETWNRNIEAWDRMTAGIHALLSELGPIPEGGWDVKLYCHDPEGLLRHVGE